MYQFPLVGYIDRVGEVMASPMKHTSCKEDKNDKKVAMGYDISYFIELPPKDLMCSECESVLRDPCQTECGHIYCNQCIAKIEERSCRICLSPVRSRAISKDYQRKGRVLELSVRCYEKGCPWTGELRDLETHIREQCAFNIVECEYRYAGCMVVMSAKEMREHLENKSHHHLSLISKYFREQLNVRSDMRGRVQVAALNATGARESGGVMEAEVERMVDHPEEDNCAHQQPAPRGQYLREKTLSGLPFVNLSLVLAVIVAALAIAYQQQDTFSANDTTIHYMKCFLDIKNQLDSLEKQVKAENVSTKKLKADVIALSVRNEVLTNSTEESLRSVRTEISKMLAHFQEKLNRLQKTTSADTTLQKEEKIMLQVQELYQDKSKTTEKQIDRMQKLLYKLETRLDFVDDNIKRMIAERLQISEISASYPILNLHITVPVSPSTSTWQSSNFYSDSPGYKMRLVIKSTTEYGIISSNKKKLGVYLRIEPGEFDGNLLWPSNLKVGIFLLHPNGNYYTKNRYIMLKLFPNEESGWSEYISSKDWDVYITNNVVHFKVFNYSK